jgi:histidine triad (HIT) family protein
MASIFSKIISGEMPCYKVAENDDFIAFLDVLPVVKGHTLIVPKVEIDYIFDIESPVYENFWHFARKVAKGLRQAVPCKRIAVSVIGLEVPHAHIHLLPIHNTEDTVFTKPRLKLDPLEMETLAVHIATYL